MVSTFMSAHERLVIVDDRRIVLASLGPMLSIANSIDTRIWSHGRVRGHSVHTTAKPTLSGDGLSRLRDSRLPLTIRCALITC